MKILRMLLVIGLEMYATENWVLQVVLGPLSFYVMNHVSRGGKKVLKFSVEFFCHLPLYCTRVGGGAVGLPLNMTTVTPDNCGMVQYKTYGHGKLYAHCGINNSTATATLHSTTFVVSFK